MFSQYVKHLEEFPAWLNQDTLNNNLRLCQIRYQYTFEILEHMVVFQRFAHRKDFDKTIKLVIPFDLTVEDVKTLANELQDRFINVYYDDKKVSEYDYVYRPHCFIIDLK